VNGSHRLWTAHAAPSGGQKPITAKATEAF